MPSNSRLNGLATDAYYTPDYIASEMIAIASVDPRTVMDAAVGDGALLRAASRRWPSARFIGLDVDQRQLRRTKARHPQWSLGRLDMFSDRSRAASTVWQSSRNSVDLIVLNPPFSYRGGYSTPVVLGDSQFSLTPASAFVALSLSRLSPDGEVLALMPAGVLELERDAAFWASVSAQWDVDVRGNFSRNAFQGTRTKSVLVSVAPKSGPSLGQVVDFAREPHSCVELVRGRVPVHALAECPPGPTAAPFVHTRDLATLAEAATTRVHTSASLATVGPFLTLPRVGRVRPDHVKVVHAPREVVLSDCVFALRGASLTDLEALRLVVSSHIVDLQKEYVGGCAPYLTVRRLLAFLARHGYCGHHVPASGPSRMEVGTLTCAESSVNRASS
jgi:hypothetical protein